MRRSLRQAHRSQHSSLSELNITPLLDLVFVLLVIFIIVTPQFTNNLQLSLPSGKSFPDVSKKLPDEIVVIGGGRILLNHKPATLVQLKSTLGRQVTTNPETSVIVNGTDDANYQTVIDVLDVIQQLKITRVGVGTETIQAKPD